MELWHIPIVAVGFALGTWAGKEAAAWVNRALDRRYDRLQARRNHG